MNVRVCVRVYVCVCDGDGGGGVRVGDTEVHTEGPTHAAPTRKPTAAGSAHSGNSKRHRAEERARKGR